MAVKSWEVKAQIARDIRERERLLPEDKLPSKGRLDVSGLAEESELFDAIELAITNSDATGIVGKIQKQEWMAEQVVVTFSKSHHRPGRHLR